MALRDLCGVGPLLFRRKNGKVDKNKKSKLRRVPSSKRFTTSSPCPSHVTPKHKGGKKHRRTSSQENLVIMTIIREKTLNFRDVLDLPPCIASTSITELIMETVKDLRHLYPNVVSFMPNSEVDGTTMHKALASFCAAMKAVEDMWMNKSGWVKKGAANTFSKLTLTELEKKVLVMLDVMIKLGKEKMLEVIDEDEQMRDDTSLPRSSKVLSESESFSDKMSSGSPATPTSVLPETRKTTRNNSSKSSSYSPPLLLPLRVQAVGKLNPIDLKRLSFHMFPYVANPLVHNKRPPDNLKQEDDEEHNDHLDSEAPDVSSPSVNSPPEQQEEDELVAVETVAMEEEDELVAVETVPMEEEDEVVVVGETSDPSTLYLPSDIIQTPPPSPPPPPPPSQASLTTVLSLPSLPETSLTTALSPPSQPPPPPPPPRSISLPVLPTEQSIPPPPPAKGGGPPPPPLPTKEGGAPPPPPPLTKGGAPPPPPLSKGGAPPPPPGLAGGRSTMMAKTSKLKRSSQMGNLYRLLKVKVEGSNLDRKQSHGRKAKAASSGGNGKQGMADALAEMTKRSSYYQQIEGDVKTHAQAIQEVKIAINNFQVSNMDELLKFHTYVESHLEKLTDESQVLARFEGFPGRKLEALRMAASLYSKLDLIATTLKNWKLEGSLSQMLDKAENYFNKIKGELDALERTKDDEAKKFKSHGILFDFIILQQIKELLVDLSSNCLETALKEKELMSANDNQGQKGVPTKVLWRTFQFAFRIYTFAGGQDERADRLTRELARVIECDPR